MQNSNYENGHENSPHNRQGIRMRADGKNYILSPSRAFSLAHDLLKARRYDAAARILEALLSTGDYGPRVPILLACCKAGLKDYTGCNNLLHSVFADETDPIIDNLQAAFIFDRVGMKADAIEELVKVVEERPELPTVCLLLGDLFAALGKKNNAARCFLMAAERDQGQGLVAHAAKVELDCLNETNVPANH